MTVVETIRDEAELCTTPNVHAAPPRLIKGEGFLEIRGYQNFRLDGRGPEVDAKDFKLQRKCALLEKFFRPTVMRGQSVLDLGAAGGFFSFLALKNRAAGVTAVDIDEDYLDMMRAAKADMGLANLRIMPGNVADVREGADIVIAFALVHWLYSCSSAFGSLESVVGFLAGLTNDLLLVEWISPEDPAIQFFRHTDCNPGCVTEPYTFVAFDRALRKHFAVVESVGYVDSTRKLFAAWKSPHRRGLDHDCPLPELHPAKHVVSSRRLTPVGGAVEYWSRVYDLGDRIVKQASGDLAAREAEFLSELKGPGFARMLEGRQESGFSVLVEEKVSGHSLEHGRECLRKNPEALRKFAIGCVRILRCMREKGIVHRDIVPENIFLRDGEPVLLDFGWAQRTDQPFIIPPGLGCDMRPPDGSFCDVYSMGKVLEYMAGDSVKSVKRVCGLMTNSDASLRVMNLDVLEELFSVGGP